MAADKKISQLDAAAAISGTELIEVVQGGVNKRTTPAAIKTFIGDAAPTGEGQNDGLLTHEDKTKLNGIEAGATADQTAQEIATAIDADGTAESTIKAALALNHVSNKTQQFFHGFMGRTGSSLSFNNGTFTLTLAVPTSQTLYINGVPYVLTGNLTAQLAVEAPAVGIWYITVSISAGVPVLTASQDAWDIEALTAIPCATVFWTGTAGAVMDERHGHDRNLELHKYLHLTVGARIQNDGSFAQTRPTTANDGHIELVAGTLWDEDIDNAISTAKGKLCRLWFETAAGVWTFVDGTDNTGYDRPFIWNAGTSRVQFPETDNTYTLADAGPSGMVPLWVYASNDVDRPLYVVTPAMAAAYSNISSARTATAPVLPFAPELKLLYRWIFRGDGEYQEAADYRTASSLPSGGVSAPVASSVSFAPSGGIVATNVQAAIEELDTEKLPITGGTIATYQETGATLTFLAEADGDIEVPLDGRQRSLTITGDCSLVAVPPTTPQCGSAVVWILINTGTPPTIGLPAAWNWPESVTAAIPTTNAARCRLLLASTPQEWVVADVLPIGVPA